MKLRHVRAVAVFVGVVVALTGARHSSGAGCSGHSSNSDSSSHSSTGGGSTHYDDDDDSVSGSGSDSGSGGVSETTLGEPTQDLTIAECKVENGSLVADVRATNSSTAETYSYMFQVAFKDASGTTAATGSSGIFSLAPGASDSALVTASSTVTDGTCELVDPQRISAS
ncbi:hypothetical protein OG866_24915 [Streptomyces sp. NBC_00663]|uniref:hypothetical protein n=1 Tax=Streptomyces sp. NBC_00663 TaxID=2975801 RepID=UPI002E32DA77|nr:hypothetical protein [Streptomyces sp. NBC_00663]